eukprot:616043-Prorocentrum_minimum.AAC.1
MAACTTTVQRCGTAPAAAAACCPAGFPAHSCPRVASARRRTCRPRPTSTWFCSSIGVFFSSNATQTVKQAVKRGPPISPRIDTDPPRDKKLTKLNES